MKLDDDKSQPPTQPRRKLRKGQKDKLAGNDTGPTAFGSERTKEAGDTYPLKLTQLERDTLAKFDSLTDELQKKIKGAAEGAQIIPVTW